MKLTHNVPWVVGPFKVFRKFWSKVPHRPYGPFYEILPNASLADIFACAVVIVHHNDTLFSGTVPAGCPEIWGLRP